MRKNSHLISLNIYSNKENLSQNSYAQYTSNSSSNRKNLNILDNKSQVSLNSFQNKMPDDKNKTNYKNIKYEDYYTLKRNNNNKNNLVIPRLNNCFKNQIIINSSTTEKKNYKIINGKLNSENINNTIQNQNLKNNHSFYESKYNTKKENSVSNNLLSKYEKDKISKTFISNINEENTKASSILNHKNLIKKHIILNVDKISNKKNELIYQNSCKKPLTPLVSISQEKRNSIINSNRETIQINNTNNQKTFNQVQNTVISRQINSQNNSIINDRKQINQSKSSDIFGFVKTDASKGNNIENKSKNDEINNKHLNSILKNCLLSPKINSNNQIINSRYNSLNNICNEEKSDPNSNFSQKTSINKSKRVIINNKSLFPSNYDKNRENKTFKLDKKYFPYNPKLPEYMTINNDNKTLRSIEKNNNSNKKISQIKSTIFNTSTSNLISHKKTENKYILSPLKNSQQITKNLNDENKIIKCIPKIIKNNNNKINLRENSYLITPKNHELISKTIENNNLSRKNKSKSELTIFQEKTFVNPYIQNRINYIKSCKSISVSGINEEGHKKRNQDTFLIERNINGIYNFNLFGVLDGHGDDGHYVSQFVREFIINSIKNNNVIKKCSTPKEIYEKIKSDKYKLIEKIFLEADIQIRKEKFDYKESGTTCIIIIQLEEKIICANTGDSRAIIVHNRASHKNQNNNNNLNNTKVFPLSYDCKPELPNERKRIYECGGEVEKVVDELDKKEEGPYRVYAKGEDYPGLAMSRSIGDLDAKKIGVIPNPQFIEYTINDDTKYMIICSDGIWEFINNDEAMEIGNEYYLNNDPSGLCQCLYETSFNYWNEDDITVDDITAIVVFF